MSLTAQDLVGNTATVSCSYGVQYVFGGFVAPVQGAPTVNLGKAGRTYPVKWQLSDAAGASISSLAAVSAVLVKQTACSAFTSDPSDALTVTTSGTSGLRYDSSDNQYIYNWATPAPGCYTLFVNLADGTTQHLFFNLD